MILVEIAAAFVIGVFGTAMLLASWMPIGRTRDFFILTRCRVFAGLYIVLILWLLGWHR